MRKTTGLLNVVTLNVDVNNLVCWEQTHFKLFAKEFHHLQKDCIEVPQDQSVVYLGDENGYFFICFPRTEMAVVDAASHIGTFLSKRRL